MNKKLIYLLIPLGLVAIMISCDEDSNNPTNIDLLTNGSSKNWYLSKIVNPSSISIVPKSCIADDENRFEINGNCLIDNKGTIYSQGPPGFFMPPLCKDTIDIIDIASWTLNSKMDSLTISANKYVLIGKIIKLTTDSLIVKRTYDGFYMQTEYYVSK